MIFTTFRPNPGFCLHFLIFAAALLFADSASMVSDNAILAPDSIPLASVPSELVNADVLFSQAKQAYKKGDFAGAIDLLLVYRDAAGANYALEYYLGMAFLRVGQPEWAMLHLERARAMDKTHEDGILFVLGQIYAFTGHQDRATECYRDLFSKYPKSPYAQNARTEHGGYSIELEAALTSAYHTNSQSLSPIDSNRVLKEDGWIHGANSRLRLERGKHALVISGFHDNALETGIRNYTMGSLVLERVLGKAITQFGIQASASQTDLEAANVSFAGEWTPASRLSLSGSWTWQADPNPKPAYNHWASLGMRMQVLESQKTGLGVFIGVNANRTELVPSTGQMGIVYVSGVTEGQNTQTGFFSDPGYMVPVTPQAIGFAFNPYWYYQDVPNAYFELADPGRWISLKSEAPGSSVQARFEVMLSWRPLSRLSILLQPSFLAQYYPESYYWFQTPVMTSDPGMGREPYLLDGLWYSAYHSWLSRPFSIYQNREDGGLYYRDYDSNGKYYPLSLEQAKFQRLDQAAMVSIGLGLDLIKKASVGLSYTFSARTSNLPDDAPVKPGFLDHSVQVQFGYSLLK